MIRKPAFWLALALNLMFAGISGAQPGIYYRPSLDAMVAKSPLVFRGAISSYSRTVMSAPWTNFVRGVTTGPWDGIFDYALVFRVDEVLKGPASKTVKLALEVRGFDKVAEQWADQHTEFLCFAGVASPENQVPTNGPMPLWRVIRLGEAVPDERAFSTPLVVKPPVALLDFTELSDLKDILARARWSAKQGFSTSTFELPFGFMEELEVPITPTLETTARQLVRSNDVTGIRALGYFKSAKNIRLIKPFLNDTNYYDTGIQNCPWVNKRIYRLREAAYQVLTNWGVKVPQTVCEERLPWHYDPFVRQPLEVRIPTTIGTGPIGPKGDTIAMGTDFQMDEVTHVLVGSNMVTGVRFEWFVYPDGQPRPSTPARVDQDYWPMLRGLDYLREKMDGLVRGQKYVVELNYTLFETDNPPVAANDPDGTDTENWRPQDGRNYRVFVRRTLTNTFEFQSPISK